MEALKHLFWVEFSSYNLISQDSQFLACQTISTKQQLVCPENNITEDLKNDKKQKSQTDCSCFPVRWNSNIFILCSMDLCSSTLS